MDEEMNYIEDIHTAAQEEGPSDAEMQELQNMEAQHVRESQTMEYQQSQKDIFDQLAEEEKEIYQFMPAKAKKQLQTLEGKYRVAFLEKWDRQLKKERTKGLVVAEAADPFAYARQSRNGKDEKDHKDEKDEKEDTDQSQPGQPELKRKKRGKNKQILGDEEEETSVPEPNEIPATQPIIDSDVDPEEEAQRIRELEEREKEDAEAAQAEQAADEEKTEQLAEQAEQTEEQPGERLPETEEQEAQAQEPEPEPEQSDMMDETDDKHVDVQTEGKDERQKDGAWNLTDEQFAIAKIVTDTWVDKDGNIVKEPTERKSLWVNGASGTGKSYLLKYIYSGLCRHPAFGPKSVALIQYTPEGVFVNGGISFYSFLSGKCFEACRLYHTQSQTHHYMVAGKVPGALAKWNNLKVLLIDDAHRISGTEFEQLEYHARHFRLDKNGGMERMFGGLQIVVAADFGKMTPSKSEYIMSASIMCHFHKENYFTLHRDFVHDKEFGNILRNMRDGTLSDEQIGRFCTQQPRWAKKKWQDEGGFPIQFQPVKICRTTAEAHKYNLEQFRKLKAESALYVKTRTYPGKFKMGKHRTVSDYQFTFAKEELILSLPFDGENACLHVRAGMQVIAIQALRGICEVGDIGIITGFKDFGSAIHRKISVLFQKMAPRIIDIIAIKFPEDKQDGASIQVIQFPFIPGWAISYDRMVSSVLML